MLIEEVLDEIQSRVKPYVGIMPQSTFSNAIKAIKNGTYKNSKREWFMSRFGYGKSPDEWVKKPRVDFDFVERVIDPISDKK